MTKHLSYGACWAPVKIYDTRIPVSQSEARNSCGGFPDLDAPSDVCNFRRDQGRLSFGPGAAVPERFESTGKHRSRKSAVSANCRAEFAGAGLAVRTTCLFRRRPRNTAPLRSRASLRAINCCAHLRVYYVNSFSGLMPRCIWRGCQASSPI